MQKEGTTNEGGLQGELEQIKDLNTFHRKRAYEIKRGEEHLKKHLA